MPKVTSHIKSTRGKEIKCSKCSAAIGPKEQYRKWSKRVGFGRISGITYYRCSKPECYPKGSELLSGRAAEIASFSESLNDIGCRDIQESIDRLHDLKDDVENFMDECQSSFDNMPEGLQQGPTGELLETRVDQASEVINSIEQAICELEELVDDMDDEDNLENYLYGDESMDDPDILDTLQERKHEDIEARVERTICDLSIDID